MAKKQGMLGQQLSGAIPAKRPARDVDSLYPTQKPRPRKKPQDFKNQKVSIKIPDELKKDIDTLKATEKLRYDYEVLQLLVDSYKQNLPRDRYRQFELLREIM